MQTETLLRWKGRIGGRSTRVVHHHAMTKTVSTMNLWTYTPSFPLDLFLLIKTAVSSDFYPEHDRPHSPYIPMTSSIRHSFFDVFATCCHISIFQWKQRGLCTSTVFLWKPTNHASTRSSGKQHSVESMNENTLVVFMPSTGHLLQVDDDRCYGCAACIMVCPVDALNLHGWLVEVDHATCTLCDHCLPSCPVDALSMELLS